MGLLRQRLTSRFGDEVQEISALWQENTIRALLGFIQPRRILEVGTHRGGSSALFAQCGSRVLTLDKEHHAVAEEVWSFLGLRDKIERRIVSSEAEKHAIIDAAEFDMAFLDAAKGPDGEADFFKLSRCQCVLVRDYTPLGPLAEGCRQARRPQWVAFIDSLEPRAYVFGFRCSMLALWLGPDSPHRANSELLTWLTREDRIVEEPW